MMVELAARLPDHGFSVDVVTEEEAARFSESVRSRCSIYTVGGTGGGRVTGSMGARVVRLRRYLRSRRPDLIFAAWRVSEAFIAWRLAGRPGGFVVNAQVALEPIWRSRNRVVAGAHRAFLCRVYRQVAGVVAVSEGVADEVRRVSGQRATNVEVIPNAACGDGRTLGSANGCPSRAGEVAPQVVAAGKMVPQKGFDVLIRAFRRVVNRRDARLLILGDGPQRSDLEKLVSDLGLENSVKMPGYVDDVFPYLRESQVFALSSRWEGCPLAIAEALSVGLPVVAADCRSGPREMLDGGRVGELVAVEDDVALAEGIERMLDAPADPEEIIEYARLFSSGSVISRYSDCFDRLLAD